MPDDGGLGLRQKARQTLPGLLLLHCRIPDGARPNKPASAAHMFGFDPLGRRHQRAGSGGATALYKRRTASHINQPRCFDSAKAGTGRDVCQCVA